MRKLLRRARAKRERVSVYAFVIADCRSRRWRERAICCANRAEGVECGNCTAGLVCDFQSQQCARLRRARVSLRIC